MPKSVFTDAYASFLTVVIGARRRAGVTQIELGARLGKTQSFVSTYERGVRRIDIVEFYAIARALDLVPSNLFQEVERLLPQRVEI